MGPVWALLAIPYIHTERIPFWLEPARALLAVPYIHTERIPFWLEPVRALLAVPYIHTERIPFLVGACPNIPDFALHPYRKNSFLVGTNTNIHIFPLHPFFDILKFDGAFSLRCIKSHHRFNTNSERMASASFGRPTAFGSTPALDKAPSCNEPTRLSKAYIPRFPEPAPPHEDTDPATAERLGLDRRQMRDTIAYFDGKGCLDLISLSSRRRGRHIAQMPPVRAGGRNNSSHIF